MRQEISKSGMLRVYDDEGNCRMCMQLSARQQPTADEKAIASESGSSFLSSPYTALAISLLSQS